MHEQCGFGITKITIKTTNYIYVSCDEMINIDNQSWILIHAYVVEDFKRTHILVNLKWVIEGYTTNNFTNMIRNLVKGFRGLFDHDLATKVICFDAHGVATFQGIKTEVAT